jgi:hypothetical protein
MELLTWLRSNTGMQPKRATAPAASVSASPVASPDASDDLAGRRERKAGGREGGLLKAAEEAFPDDRVKVPPLRAIQATLGCGQPKAQEVQAHLKTLAGAR